MDEKVTNRTEEKESPLAREWRAGFAAGAATAREEMARRLEELEGQVAELRKAKFAAGFKLGLGTAESIDALSKRVRALEREREVPQLEGERAVKSGGLEILDEAVMEMGELDERVAKLEGGHTVLRSLLEESRQDARLRDEALARSLSAEIGDLDDVLRRDLSQMSDRIRRLESEEAQSRRGVIRARAYEDLETGEFVQFVDDTPRRVYDELDGETCICCTREFFAPHAWEVANDGPYCPDCGKHLAERLGRVTIDETAPEVSSSPSYACSTCGGQGFAVDADTGRPHTCMECSPRSEWCVRCRRRLSPGRASVANDGPYCPGCMEAMPEPPAHARDGLREIAPLTLDGVDVRSRGTLQIGRGATLSDVARAFGDLGRRLSLLATKRFERGVTIRIEVEGE